MTDNEKVVHLPVDSGAGEHYRELALVYLDLDRAVFTPAGYPAPPLGFTHGRGWALSRFGFLNAPDMGFLHQSNMFHWLAIQIACRLSGTSRGYLSRKTVAILSAYGIAARPGRQNKQPLELIPGGLLEQFTGSAREYHWFVPLTDETRATLDERAKTREALLAALPSCPVIPLK